MIALTAHAEGVLLKVRAQPGARKNGIQGVRGEALKVSVQAPPEDGRANAALAEVLCTALELHRSQVVLHSGATSRDKVFLLCDVDVERIQSRLNSLLGDAS